MKIHESPANSMGFEPGREPGCCRLSLSKMERFGRGPHGCCALVAMVMPSSSFAKKNSDWQNI